MQSDNTEVLVIIKKNPASFFEDLKTESVPSIVQVLQWSQQDSFQNFSTILSQLFEPMLNSVVQSKTSAEKLKGATSALQNLVNLKTSLSQYQLSFQLPEVNLLQYIHPKIKSAVEKSSIIEISDLDDRLIDDLIKNIALCCKELQKITKLEAPEINNVQQEINYWTNIQRIIENASQQIQNREVGYMIELLRVKRRMQAAATFDDEKKKLEIASQVAIQNSSFLKEVPISKLTSSMSIKELSLSLTNIFATIKKLKITRYPLPRAVKLVECISKETCNKCLELLNQFDFFGSPYVDFERELSDCLDLFNEWSMFVKSFEQIMKEIAKIRPEEKQLEQPTLAHLEIEKRLGEIRDIRRELEEFIQVLSSLPSSFIADTESNSLEEVLRASSEFKLMANLLNITQNGIHQWKLAKDHYITAIDKAETSIAKRLRLKMATAKSSNEMLKIFSKFNALFYRQKISSAIHEYQVLLVERAKEDVKVLENKFKNYSMKSANNATKLKDLLPVSSNIMWMKQIETRLFEKVFKIEAIFGKGWERLAKLQRKNYTWLLDDPLADFIGIPLSKINQKISQNQELAQLRPEFVGTAFVLAFFETMYPNSKNEWDHLCSNARMLLQQSTADLKFDVVKEIAKMIEDLSIGLRHIEGKVLRVEAENFKDRISKNIELEMKAWNTNAIDQLSKSKIFKLDNQNRVDIQGSILEIEKRQDETLDLKTTFDKSIVSMIKDCKLLIALGYMKLINEQIFLAYLSSIEVFPVALSIGESIRSFTNIICRKLENNPNAEYNSILMANKVNDVLRKLTDGLKMTWLNTELEKFSKELSDTICSLSIKIQELQGVLESIEAYLTNLSKTPFSPTSFHDILNAIQVIIDKMSLENYANFKQWVVILNARIEYILISRLQDLFTLWKNSFSSLNGNDFNIGELNMNITIAKKRLSVAPSVQGARQYFYAHLHGCIMWICNCKQIEDKFSKGTESATKTYEHLICKLPTSQLHSLYAMIENNLQTVMEYLCFWKNYEVYWSIDASSLFSKIEEDFPKWHVLIVDIKKVKKLISSTEETLQFGRVSLQLKDIKAKVIMKYEEIYKEALSRMKSAVGQYSKRMSSALLEDRKTLESISFQTDILDNFVTFAGAWKNLHSKYSEMEQMLPSMRQLESLLNKSKVKLPQDWVYFDQLESMWIDFNSLSQKKSEQFDAMKQDVMIYISREEKKLQTHVEDLVLNWKNSKPFHSSTTAEMALSIIIDFEGKVTSARQQFNKVLEAKSVLDLETSMSTSVLSQIDEEITSLKQLWQRLQEFWKRIAAIKEYSFAQFVPVEVRSVIDSISNEIKTMNAWITHYPPVDFINQTIDSILQALPLFKDLKGGFLKERHWSRLQQITETKISEKSKLGELIDINLKKFERPIQDIMQIAQGELALEKFFDQIKDFWTHFKLSFVLYHNKCFVVKSWDEILNQAYDHLKSLDAMKASPFFKSFAEDWNIWDDRINRIRMFADIWIDVQKAWVYLERVFLESADIQNQLLKESNIFKNLHVEFIKLMKMAKERVYIIEIIQVANIQQTLENLKEKFAKIQKSLGEYLEKQRQQFPRFYFVGDDDLLEIIGSSENIDSLQKHLKKMFAGISSLVFDQSNTITSVVSKEGEVVVLSETVTVGNKESAETILKKLEASCSLTLKKLLGEAIPKFEIMFNNKNQLNILYNALEMYPIQVSILANQVVATRRIEQALNSTALAELESVLSTLLPEIALHSANNIHPLQRKKLEMFITELVHQRDVVRYLLTQQIGSSSDFSWLYFMRHYWNEAGSKLEIEIANVRFEYGFEYLGVYDKLVQTPLTDKCFLVLSQALHSRLGGSPFGPAGTGKTESVKFLGAQLGKFVLVFNCDESFDVNAMGRIFVGICETGMWGCFDEFNRLEEKMLSSVSQQIQTIQTGLKEKQNTIELIGRKVNIKSTTGIFITMNPEYIGRSNLPDNLKQLFRPIAMEKPDKELITQVILYTRGFGHAEILSKKVVLFFDLCNTELSKQMHYDFGLRALKSVLNYAGNIKRSVKGPVDEYGIVAQSIFETINPKLIESDRSRFMSIVKGLFPNSDPQMNVPQQLQTIISETCARKFYNDSVIWKSKILNLYQLQSISHGIILVGDSASGKTSCWRVLLDALSSFEKTVYCSYVIEPKAITKEELFGSFDSTTREWTDGIFSNLLRKIIENARGESNQKHWIVFDGDIDPVWVENLNSVLDDNKLFTLPNGERLLIPDNVKLIFEVQNLQYATLATVSRCSLVWFEGNTISETMYLDNLVHTMCSKMENSEVKQITLNLFEEFKQKGNLEKCISEARSMVHVMPFNSKQALSATMVLFARKTKLLLTNVDMDVEIIKSFVEKSLCFSLVWGFGSSASFAARTALSSLISSLYPEINVKGDIIDFDVEITSYDATWTPLRGRVVDMNFDVKRMSTSNTVIPTLDTVRHENLIASWITLGHGFILCGPAGSGKTLSLTNCLKTLPDFEYVYLNFSSATQPSVILKTLEKFCKILSTKDGLLMKPFSDNKTMVVFCDEINLPRLDAYGTQPVISFIRQLIEQKGFWRTSDMQFIKLENIMFVGACNPPSDVGRVELSSRFSRHLPLLFVDFPTTESLKKIYGTFNKAILKTVPQVATLCDATTSVMIEVYNKNQERFTTELQPHYIYSPRDLSRWIRAMQVALEQNDNISVEEYIQLLIHEASRIFSDKLVLESERTWFDEMVDATILKYFPNIEEQTLERPLLFSNWLSKHYVRVSLEKLKSYIEARMKTFSEEEIQTNLILFDDVVDHILRMDRVLKQPLGHLLLVGNSGVGKKVLAKFVTWINGYSIFQIKSHRNYTIKDFEDDLRHVMKRSGCKGEKMVFIFDESNILQPTFLEYMNSLLASGEIPGLFENDDYKELVTLCKQAAQHAGKNLNTNEEIYKWFTAEVQKNLHIVFTINPSKSSFVNRTSTSPALFNRCVIDWLGDWSENALTQVSNEFAKTVALDTKEECKVLSAELLNLHFVVKEFFKDVKTIFITPRHFMDFISHFSKLFDEKTKHLQDQQMHLSLGLTKLKETEKSIAGLQQSIAVQNTQLKEKNAQANIKLQQLVQEKKEAEEKKLEAMSLSEELAIRQKEINIRKGNAQMELDSVIPALEAAKSAIQDIKKKNLDEIRNLANPPIAIQRTLEALIILLSDNIKIDVSWNEIRKAIRGDDFIPRILQYKSQQLSDKTRKKLIKDYISDPQLSVELVYRASQACGPMMSWIDSQLKYASIVEKVAPLKSEIEKLEVQASSLSDKLQGLQTMIDSLEQQIVKNTNDYSILIGETETIKIEISKINSKLERASKLFSSLASESTRWKQQIDSMMSQKTTVLGSCLLAAVSLTVGGSLNEKNREVLFEKLILQMQKSSIPFNADFSVAEFLATGEQRLQWFSHGLPDDKLFVENVCMLQRFNRYPLIIDPSNQAVDFIMSYYNKKKIVKASILDKSFLKTLESAIRFGTTILVEDAEQLDTILNPILNKELRRVGGRSIVRLGSQDIDISPTFSLLLSTREGSNRFDADIQSKLTCIDFSITPHGLQSQCLQTILKKEKPEVERIRSDELKLQGQYKIKLRELEESLLDALMKCKTNILDDEVILKNLEELKQSSQEVEEKMKISENSVSFIRAIHDYYMPFAALCSKVYFSTLALKEIHFMYHFSLDFLFEIIQSILEDKTYKPEEDRVLFLTRNLFTRAFVRIKQSLLFQDNIVYGIVLALLKLESSNVKLDKEEKDILLKQYSFSNDSLPNVTSATQRLSIRFIPINTALVGRLVGLNAFELLLVHINENCDIWNLFLQSDEAEKIVPNIWSHSSSPLEIEFRKLLLLKAFRMDRFTSGVWSFLEFIFGKEFTKLGSSQFSHVASQVLSNTTPILLVSQAGYDNSSQVEIFASQSKKQLVSIAIGADESIAAAEAAFQSAVKTGSWVLLKNIHLSKLLCETIEKRLHTIRTDNSIHRQFRLFLSSELSNVVPPTLIRKSFVIINELSNGIKANLFRSYTGLDQSVVDEKPAIRSRLYLFIAWIHSQIQERLRYTPIGWSKKYEFTQNEFKAATEMLETFMRQIKDAIILTPEKLPLKALKILLCECIYGGKIDNEFDRKVLQGAIDRFFTSTAVENAFFTLASLDKKNITIPKDTSYQSTLNWIQQELNDIENPSLLGLSPQASVHMNAEEAASSLQKVTQIVDLTWQEDSKWGTGSKNSSTQFIKTKIEKILQQLNSVSTVNVNGLSSGSPIEEYFGSMTRILYSSLLQIRTDLNWLTTSLDDKTYKLTPYFKKLLDHIRKDTIPSVWRSIYECPSSITQIAAWINDFTSRLLYYSSWSDVNNGFDFGKMIHLNAFFTASRQYFAQLYQQPLEQLRMTLSQNKEVNTLSIDGIAVQNAIWKETYLELCDTTMLHSMPRLYLNWKVVELIQQEEKNAISLPLFLDVKRGKPIIHVNISVDSKILTTMFYQRGSALFCTK